MYNYAERVKESFISVENKTESELEGLVGCSQVQNKGKRGRDKTIRCRRRMQTQKYSIFRKR